MLDLPIDSRAEKSTAEKTRIPENEAVQASKQAMHRFEHHTQPSQDFSHLTSSSSSSILTTHSHSNERTAAFNRLLAAAQLQQRIALHQVLADDSQTQDPPFAPSISPSLLVDTFHLGCKYRMEAEDAQKALRLAFKHDANGDTAAAIKWTKKSIAIFKTPSAEALLVRLEKSGASGNGASTSASASASTSSTAAGTSAEVLRSRASAQTNGRSASETTHTAPKRAYTQAQMEVVTKVKTAGGDFYKVLGVEKTVDENGIKKAYKKLALQLHPDKNGAPGADEAFKVVSKAFSILTDADKRAAYDRYGGDPDNARSAAGAAAAGRGNPFGGMGGAPFRGGGMYGDEIDPNDLFNMFFGGGMGMGGAQFGGTTFTFGGPGMRTHQFRQHRPGQRRAQEPQNANILLQLLPLLVLGLFSLLAYAPSLFSTPDPSFTWSPSSTYKTQRMTSKHHVPYYVNDNQFNNHPFVTGETSKKDLAGFENRVENAYKQAMYSSCERSREYQENRLRATRGFLGIGADEAAAKKIMEEVYDSCERLRDFGIHL